MSEQLDLTESTDNALAGDGFVGGVDLGGTKILAVVVGPKGDLVGRAKKATGRNHEPSAVIDRIVKCLTEAASEAGITPDQLRAVGIGAPGPVVRDEGVVTVAVNLDWHNVPLKTELESRLGVPVVVENDVRVAVLAEHVAGAGRGTRSMVGIWPGTGIGGGVIVNGEIVNGANNAAGEIGHITIKAGGPLCACGGRGHLEALASRSAISREIADRVRKGKKTLLTALVEGDVAKATSGDLAEAFRQGDKVVVRSINRSAKYLSMGIASIANVLNPEMIVLGGGLVEALGEPYVRRVTEEVRERPMFAATGSVQIVPAALQDDAGVVGACLIARRLATTMPTPPTSNGFDESVAAPSAEG